jgi:ATP-dependent helicase/DNAse subunit B
MIIDKLKNNTILVVNNNIKNEIIEIIREKSLLNIKFMTLEELKKNYYFTYDEKTIYYLINKYHYKYDVAVKYLNNLIYIDSSKEYQDDKLKFLSKLKQELDQNNLLKYNKLFISSLKNYNLLIYNYRYLKKEELNFIEELKNITNVEVYNDNLEEYSHQYVYEFNEIDEEIVFVASRICNLIQNGIDINKIKICGINDEYNNLIKKYFNFYNLNIVINNSYLYATKMGQEFLNNLDNGLDNAIKYLETNYKLIDEGELSLYNSIIKIINKYAWLEDITKAKELIIHDFKNHKINKKNLAKRVEIIKSLENVNDEDYIFLMNFNQAMIPNTYKDEDYLSDKLKNKLNLSNTSDLNKLSSNKWLQKIKSVKNLTITYKLHSLNGDYYLSSLADTLNLKRKKEKINYNYSNLYNKIKLTEYIDILVKYNLKSEDLSLLYNNYKEINYMTYDNKYLKVDKNKLKKYLDNSLTLSYSAINNYYHCAFRYYLSNILKLNIYEETFYTIIGNLFHYILSICFNQDINLEKKYYEYIAKQSYPFNAREKFFLDNLLKELVFIIDTIKNNNEYSTLSNTLYEEKITIDKSKANMKIIFKGFVDKIMLDSSNSIASIIDYKTGNPNLNLNNSIYGLDLQLPVYVYLVKNKFPNIRIVGFYLQKILNNEISLDNKHSYEELKKDKLKLQGYSNSDENLLNLFDSNYQESKVIKGMRTTSKGIASKKILDDVAIDKLADITDNKINEAIDKILNSDFDINPKRIGTDTIGCKYCQYKDICFMSEKDIITLKEYKNMEFLEEEYS